LHKKPRFNSGRYTYQPSIVYDLPQDQLQDQTDRHERLDDFEAKEDQQKNPGISTQIVCLKDAASRGIKKEKPALKP